MNIMTLDEAIIHAEEVAKKMFQEECINCAENHLQLAAWLKELKNLRLLMEDDLK